MYMIYFRLPDQEPFVHFLFFAAVCMHFICVAKERNHLLLALFRRWTNLLIPGVPLPGPYFIRIFRIPFLCDDRGVGMLGNDPVIATPLTFV